ncbi:N-acetylmuramic acid 6-phosphate etherase [Primorskyibacter sp. S187A]|uniref:N-acetylmuramic acid 6-phosphate etherase n=1 Tax=Primorskyibacter sp. S187A TaxID=3415130 RepID=UPI003C7BBD7A
MSVPTTEAVSQGDTIDAASALDAGAMMAAAHRQAAAVVDQAMPEVVAASDVMARTLRARGRIIYAAAGSSGLMALADACELPGTFGIPQRQVRIHMAGGVPASGHMPGETEDDTDTALQAMADVTSEDAIIVLSASGTTPYALSIAAAARARGATIIALANNANTPLLAAARIAICLPTPPELVAGSTRLGAGTAQKIALNIMSSLMGVRLGHVYKGLMVNVIADNMKLKRRAVGIVRQIADVSEDIAEAALAQTGGHAKPAILVASGCNRAEAQALLAQHEGQLGACFQALGSRNDT